MDLQKAHKESYLTIASCIASSPAVIAPFEPSSTNLFPKLTKNIDPDSWELWEFDTFNVKDGQTAIGLSLYRDARGLEKGGFHAEMNVIWEDGRKWSETLYFAESTISQVYKEGNEGSGRLQGIWKSRVSTNQGNNEAQETDNISFTVSADCSVVTICFAVPGMVEGSIQLNSSSVTKLENRLPATEQAALLCSNVYYMFPMGPLIAQGDMVFSFTSDNGSPEEMRRTILSPGKEWCGGTVRGWSSRAWPTFMNDAYYVVAYVGPYMVQMLHIIGSIFAQHKPRAVARLYRNDELICAANHILGPSSRRASEAPESQQDTIQVSKVFPGENEPKGLAGEYRDPNIGYRINFVAGDSQMRWEFEVRHKRAVWSEPTSAPGLDGTGKSGWVEELVGGAKDERYTGFGFGGQLQIPVP